VKSPIALFFTVTGDPQLGYSALCFGLMLRAGQWDDANLDKPMKKSSMTPLMQVLVWVITPIMLLWWVLGFIP
jgi:hypothetical protein